MTKQFNSRDKVDFNHLYMPANEAAMLLANKLHGINSWQGIANNGLYAVSGLKNLANRYLRSLPNNGYNGAVIVEDDLGDGTSHYYPSWEEIKPVSSLYDTALPIVRDLSLEACMLRG